MKVKRFVLGELMTNCYVVSDCDECVIVDPAIYSDKIENYIEKNALKVKCILLTHCHFDHILGCKAFMEIYGVNAHISKIDGELAEKLNAEFDKTVDACLTADISDGDKITFGNAVLTAISTPGHTPGGMSFYGDGVMLSGDTLFKSSIGRTDFLMGNFDDLECSVKKLYNYSDDTVVYPGHGFTTKIGYEKTTNPYFRGVN